MMKIGAPINYPGAKWSYAGWICSLMPPHKFYVEPYFGSGATFFRKPPAKYETINDIDSLVVNFFKVCREHPEELAWLLELTPFAREEFRSIQEDSAGADIKLTNDPIENARRFVVRCSQGLGNKLADRVGWKNTKHSSGPVNPHVWSKLPDTVLAVADRLKDAQIENTEAVPLIRACNAHDCLIYTDPPYLGATRKGKRIYRHEMMDESAHIELLEALLDHEGPVMLSGYDNDLYNDMLPGWQKAYKNGHANNSAKRTEVLWMNYEHQMALNWI